MATPAPPRPVSLATLYLLFFEIGALSFGGGLTAWTYREVVERRKLMAEAEFLSGLTLAQVLPGINMVNLSVFVGQHLRGRAGAIAALGGLISVPFFAILFTASIYASLKSVPWLQDFLAGLAAAAVGLMMSMGVRAIRAVAMNKGQLAIMGLVVVLVGVLRWPMIPVIVVLAPISIFLAWPWRTSEEPSDDA